jgi:hypothetical protein
MSVFIWDTSHFDGPISRAQMAQAKAQGIVSVTAKIAEGLSDTEGTHDDTTLAAARDAGIEFVGGYGIPRSNASVADQVAYLIRLADAGEPWWRDFPGWYWQVDLERWPYDAVSATVGVEYAKRLRDATGRWVILYASHGQYGDSLTGWDGPLWNADYTSHAAAGFAAMYPGDAWAPLHGSWRGGWATYSGQQPTFLQFTSSATIAGLTTCDASAFRGTTADLRALITGTGNRNGAAMALADDQALLVHNTAWMLQGLVRGDDPIVIPHDPSIPNSGATLANKGVAQALAGIAVDAHAAAALPTAVSMTDADRTAIVADLETALGGATARLEGKVDELLAALRGAAQAETAALTPPVTPNP